MDLLNRGACGVLPVGRLLSGPSDQEAFLTSPHVEPLNCSFLEKILSQAF